MKRVKRTLCVVIAGLLVMSLVACASYEDTSIQQLPDEFLHPASVAYGPTGDRQASDYQFAFYGVESQITMKLCQCCLHGLVVS